MPDNKKIASERIKILFGLAEKEAKEGNTKLADGFVEKARRIAMKHTIRLGKEYRSRYCRHCHAYLLSGKTSRTRINSKEKRVEVECNRCKGRNYYPYAREAGKGKQ